ncbi:MAG TPA: hypothetical protein P5537_10950 [Thauera sp.]|uniref:hypothetical protein n=1 Tax=Thauera sp. TaxID=1905334 RepID=UPI000FC243D9|nr:hypothetical protein [Thauera sp.]MCP5224627.1 hypothetical protein [Thauera sp.]RTL21437.1 MAG: hypothetical protein EKK55_16120 [Rhodocyclaceae bacterium]HRV78602.1 hypothetical protein [Thauera sp.]
MNYIMAVLIGFSVLLAGGTAMAVGAGQDGATAGAQVLEPQQGKKEGAKAAVTEADPGNRASLLYIVLVGGVMVVAMKMAIAYGKKKLEEEREAAREKAALEERQKRSQAKG